MTSGANPIPGRLPAARNCGLWRARSSSSTLSNSNKQFRGRAAEPGIQRADAARNSWMFATSRFSFDVDALDSGFRYAVPE
jgi:hypothetical protein